MPKVKRVALIISLSLGSVALAEESSVSPEPFYRFETTLPDAFLLPNGKKTDVVVEYFTSTSGEVAYTGLAPRKYSEDGKCLGIFRDSRGRLCWCDPLAEGGVAHFGDPTGGTGGGMLSTDIEISVAPVENADGGIDFSIELNRIEQQITAQALISGFEENAVGPSVQTGGAK